ncbi:cytosolic leucyl tRNA synthetase [Mycoemilia scoparia]|uniref:leucine--tRNA ligase n=1 Tax=Mycoemilia scoparia TaxID=417184 RepID=A0A9W7ZUR1_9FUNG|nr:cytosolic leucyl tRNA synthetase [Mycoemilia scoparia]
MTQAKTPTTATEETKKTAKRDFLIENEQKWQKHWEEGKVFEQDLPEGDWETMTAEELHEKYPKFMGTFPYPYMNGLLHLGHTFSISKIEFATSWERLQGKRALFPFGFHVTGMPIKASADKIAREIEKFGKDFIIPEEVEIADGVENMAIKQKSKIAAKTGGAKYQFQIMQSLGVPTEEIHRFADASYWLTYFPPKAIRDLKHLGCKVDWRRSFITTDANPYYDSFARWQFTRLHEMGKIKYGKRYTIWSPKDGQPCMDHDRQSGEGVGPQEYTGIKIKILKWAPEAEKYVAGNSELEGKNIFLVAATLRPETMYGQTNCYVGTKIDYIFHQVNETDVFVTTHRAARNMAFQDLSVVPGEVKSLGTIKGSDIVGSLIKAPLSVYEQGIYVLPMENVLANKGTGVVTSVPSDSPDDYATLGDLQKKPDYYGINPEWVKDYKPVPIISTPKYGDLTAKALCEKMKIQSQKDRDQLALAKEEAYKEGFYHGTMIIGDYKGKPVEEAKPLIRDSLIASGDAVAYSEPERQVMSRSADECVVSLCDQWYMTYGEPEWRKQVTDWLAKMDTYSEETRNQFERTLDWLNQWACARTYGLGSKVPFDENFLIESLSDSTIYMAYYTIAHFLHSSLDGSKPGLANITKEEMDDAAWDYVLLGKELPAGHPASDRLPKLRKSFLYWYPLDIRSSGKDLIQNHLSFFLYIHQAFFPDYSPRSVRCNGHLLLNGDKMSKSTGNFMTLQECVAKYGADATRLTLADAGDGLDDANFEETTANATILRLHTLYEWISDAVKAIKGNTGDSDVKLRSSGTPYTIVDRIFEAEINQLSKATEQSYDKMLYREALKTGFYDFQAARDWYREVTSVEGMHTDLIQTMIERQVLQLAPITPHWAEMVWKDLLGKTESIMQARWPREFIPDAVDEAMLAAGQYVRSLVKSIRDSEALLLKRKGKKGGGKKGAAAAPTKEFDPKAEKALKIYIASKFPQWQDATVATVRDFYDSETGKFDDPAIRGQLAKLGLIKDKKVMPFVQEIKKRVGPLGAQVAFNRALPFNELEVVQVVKGYIGKTLSYNQVDVVSIDDAFNLEAAVAECGEDQDMASKLTRAVDIAIPGEPGFIIYNL